MKFLTKNSDYAIRALLELAKEKDNFLSSRDIAKRQKMPYHFLRKVLRELIKNNFAISKEGGRGGFKIAKDPAKIGIGKVIEALQGRIQLSKCMFRKRLCANRASCALRKEVISIEKMLFDRLHDVTIKKLLGNI